MSRAGERGAAIVLLVGMVGMLNSPAALAQEPVWPKSYWDGATRKLGRGVANVFSAPLELFRKPALVGERDGGVSKYSVGIVQGISALVIRAGAGVVEIVTFPLPIPDTRFQPLVRPEFVYAHGEWVPDE